GCLRHLFRRGEIKMRVSRVSGRKAVGVRLKRRGFTTSNLDAAVPVPEPLELPPDVLRDQLRLALSDLSFDEYGTVREELIAGIRRAGTNVAASLLMIGAAVSDGDVLPPDLAHLVRYLRINRPESLKHVRGILARLLAHGADAGDDKSRLAA
ncbi:MAG TPA: hypothetical protein VFV34_26155, partial [Blastocatellia bacterium]|nr:hypothetical protein [Blastocatellia bacterium]